MIVSDLEMESLISQLGFTASYAISSKGGVFVPQFRLEWDHEFEDDAPDAISTYALDANRTGYGLAGIERDQDFYDLGVSLVYVTPNGWSSFIDISTLIDYKNVDRKTITAGIRKEF
jgi:hypothetical protein